VINLYRADLKTDFKAVLYSVNIYSRLKDLPKINDNTNNAIKIKKRILAMEAAPAAMPANPNNAAIIATIKKVIVQRNIVIRFN
jgi:hypothetical protein